MQRREMLKGLLIGMPVAAGAAAAASAVRVKNSAAYVKDKGQETIASLEQRFNELKDRFEKSEQKNRKIAKLALGAAALSLGIDVSSLI
jgi:hypothetical protein